MTVTFAAYGDSLTATPSISWVPEASDGVEASHIGGFSYGGYRSYQVAANTVSCPANVTVVMVGTNDVSNAMWRVPLVDTLNAIRDIIVKSSASKALIVAIPPRNDGFHVEAAQLNIDIRNYAISMGWLWVDPWTSLRTSDNKFRAGWTTDGIHPTPAGGTWVGHWLHHMILASV
jgi:lysophospholipase L1-like esterase